MPTKPIERLLFAQGGCCFFCGEKLNSADASVEHLVPKSDGGGNNDENCVVCCKTLNALLGRNSLKEKLRVVLNQKGQFQCPNGGHTKKSKTQTNPKPSPIKDSEKQLSVILKDLKKRGTARPRTVKALSSTINARFNKGLNEKQIEYIVEKLCEMGEITVDGKKVSYSSSH